MEEIMFETILNNEDEYNKWYEQVSQTINNGASEPEYILNYDKFTVNVSENVYEQMKYFQLNQHENNLKETNNKIIIYFHGGGFCMQPQAAHWKFLDRLVSETGCKIYVPIYPKVPYADAKIVYEILFKFYRELILKIEDIKDIIFMGDSAGASIALSLAYQISLKNIKRPEKIILFSPWLNITDDREDMDNIHDFLLSTRCLNKLAKLWCGKEDKNLSYISPINIELNRVGKIMLFTGTRDCLHCDSVELMERANEQNIDIKYFERSKMCHDYIIFISKGLRMDLAEIKSFIIAPV